MFKFQSSGEVLGVITGKDGVYIRMKADASDFRFTREGEVAAPMSILARGLAAETAKTLSIGSHISIDGEGGVGSRMWEKREFGKTKEKEIFNYYLNAVKITVATRPK